MGYPEDAFIEQQISGIVAADLLRGERQGTAGYEITAPPLAASNANFERIAGQRPLRGLLTAWPRTEWDQPRDATIPLGPPPDRWGPVASES